MEHVPVLPPWTPSQFAYLEKSFGVTQVRFESDWCGIPRRSIDRSWPTRSLPIGIGDSDPSVRLVATS